MKLKQTTSLILIPTLLVLSIIAVGCSAKNSGSGSDTLLSSNSTLKASSTEGSLQLTKDEENATFFIVKTEWAAGDSKSDNSDRLMSDWGIPRVRYYTFTACLLEQSTHRKIVTGVAFDITGQNGLVERHQVDDSGCLKWEEKLDFNFFAPPKYVQFQRKISAVERSVHRGARLLTFAVNPWAAYRDDGSREIIDLDRERNGNNQMPEVKVTTVGIADALRGTVRKNEKGEETAPQIPKVSLNINNFRLTLSRYETQATAEIFEASLSFNPEFLLKNIQDGRYNYRPKLGSYKYKIDLFNVIYTNGSEKPKRFKLASYASTGTNKGFVDAVQDGKFSDNFKITINKQTTKGNLEAAIVIMPDILVSDSVENFHGVFKLGEYDDIKNGGSGNPVAGLNNVDNLSFSVNTSYEYLKANGDPTTLDKEMKAAGIYDLNPYLLTKMSINFNNIEPGTETSIQRTMVFKVKTCVSYTIGGEKVVNQPFQIRLMKKDGKDIVDLSEGEKASAINSVAETLNKQLSASTPTNSKSVKPLTIEDQTEVVKKLMVEVQHLSEQNAYYARMYPQTTDRLTTAIQKVLDAADKLSKLKISETTALSLTQVVSSLAKRIFPNKFIETDADGCLLWSDSITHKYYKPERFFDYQYEITHLDSRAKIIKTASLDPWDNGWIFGRDEEEIPKDARTATNKDKQSVLIKSKFFLDFFQYQTILFKYDIDQFLNLRVNKSLLLTIVPKALRFSSLVTGRKGSEYLRDGVYLLKVGIQKDFLDKSSRSTIVSPKVDRAGFDVKINQKKKAIEYLSITEKLVLVQFSKIITPVTFIVDDLRFMRARCNLLIQLEAVDESRIIQGFRSPDGKISNDVTLSTISPDNIQKLLKDLSEEKTQQFSKTSAANEDSNIIADIKQLDQDLNKEVAKRKLSITGYDIDTLIDGDSGITGRTFIGPVVLLANSFSSSVRPLDDLQERSCPEHFDCNMAIDPMLTLPNPNGNVTISNSPSYKDPAFNEKNESSAISMSQYQLNNDLALAAAMKDIKDIDQEIASLKRNLSAVSQAEANKTLDAWTISNNGLGVVAQTNLSKAPQPKLDDDKKFYGDVTHLSDKSITELIPHQYELAGIKKVENEFRSLLPVYLKSYGLEYVSLTDTPLKMLKGFNWDEGTGSCNRDKLKDCLVDEVINDKVNNRQRSNEQISNVQISTSALLEYMNMGRNSKDDYIATSDDIHDLIVNRKLTTEQDDGVYITELGKKKSHQGRMIELRLCKFWANYMLTKRVHAEEKISSRGDIHAEDYAKKFWSDCFEARNMGAIFDVNWHLRDIVTGTVSFKGGKSQNIDLGSSMTMGNGSSKTHNLGMGMDPFTGSLKETGIFSIKTLVDFLKISTGIGAARSVDANQSTNVGARTYLAVQTVRIDIPFYQWERCMSIRVKQSFWDKINFADNYFKTFSDGEKAELMAHGIFICTGEREIPDLKDKKLPPIFPERYYYLAQQFGVGDMHDESDLLNHPWLMTLRGEMDFYDFIFKLNLNQPHDVTNDYWKDLQSIGDDAVSWNIKDKREIKQAAGDIDIPMGALRQLDSTYRVTVPSFPGIYTLRPKPLDYPQ